MNREVNRLRAECKYDVSASSSDKFKRVVIYFACYKQRYTHNNIFKGEQAYVHMK